MDTDFVIRGVNRCLANDMWRINIEGETVKYCSYLAPKHPLSLREVKQRNPIHPMIALEGVSPLNGPSFSYRDTKGGIYGSFLGLKVVLSTSGKPFSRIGIRSSKLRSNPQSAKLGPGATGSNLLFDHAISILMVH